MFDGLLQLLGVKKEEKKKQQTPVQVTQQPMRGPSLGQSPITVRQANPTQQKSPEPFKMPSFNDVGKFFVGGTAKTANTALGGIALAGNSIGQTVDQALGGRSSQYYKRNAEDINKSLLKDGSGILGAGGFMDKQQFKTASAPQALIKGAGAGAATASEIAPVGRGIVAAKSGASIGRKIADGAVQGASAGLIGATGSQIAESGRVTDPLQILQSTAVGGGIGGGIPAAVGGVKAGVKAHKDIQAGLTRQGMTANQAAQGGFARVPGSSAPTPPTSVADVIAQKQADIAQPIAVKEPRGNKITKYVAVNTTDANGKSGYDLQAIDSTKHDIKNGVVTDKKGNSVGSFLGVDDKGQQYAYVEGKPVNISGIMGNIDGWGNKNSPTWDIDRLIEANAPDSKTARKVQEFTTHFKDQQEAMMRTDLRARRDELAGLEKDLTSSLPGGLRKNDLTTDLFRAMEGKADINELTQKYGADYINNKFNPALDWARGRFDETLEKTNNVLQRNGYDAIPRRDNYITHIQNDPSFWEKAGIGIQNLNPLGSSTSSDINPGNVRGGVPDEIVGRTANTSARRKWNPFAQQRTGEAAKQDFFEAIDKYYEPMLFNQYMTPAASRARVVERAFRTNEKAKQLQVDELAEIVGMKDAKDKVFGAGKTNKNYEAGRRSPLVVAWQEYGNMLAGKTNAIDRTVIDYGGSKLLDGSVRLQGIAGASAIPGSVTAAVAQVLSLPQTIARDSPRAVLKAAKDMLGFSGKNAEDPMRKSAFMRARYTDADSRRLSAVRRYTKVASKPMEIIEREAGELSWRSAYHSALARGLKEADAITDADIVTKKTLAGRGIGDRPVAMNSKALGVFTQFGLEVNNMRLQFFNDFTPTQKLKFMVAAGALNTVYQTATGNAPLPDFIGAANDTVSDFQNKNDDKKDTDSTNALQGIQRFAGQTSKFIPGASIMAGALMDDRTREQTFGKNSELSRFGEPALTKAPGAAIDLFKGATSGDVQKARDAALSVLPTGTQVRRSVQGAEAVDKGYQTSSQGNVQSVVNKDNPLEALQALTAGKYSLQGQQKAMNSGFSLSGEDSKKFERLYKEDPQKAKDYFNKKIKEKVDDSDRSGSLTNVGEVPTTSAATGPTQGTSAQDILDKNKERSKDLKDSLSEEDYALSRLSKTDRQKLIKDGKVTQAKLDGLDNYIKGKKKELGVAEKSTKTTKLPSNLNKDAAKVFADYDAVKSTERDSWNAKPTSNEGAKKDITAWIGSKAQPPSITNEVAKDWADLQKKVTENKVTTIGVDQARSSILKKAYESQLSPTQKEIGSLSKAQLENYMNRGVISGDDIQKALQVESQMFDAGLIAKEKLSKNFAQTESKARGYKTTGGRGSKGGRGKSSGIKASSFKVPGASTARITSKGAALARNAKLQRKSSKSR
jgi:hypothetical protein